jgi:hypothetical protein
MPLSLTPKRAAETLIICDEPAVFSALGPPPAESFDLQKLTLLPASIAYKKTELDAAVTPRVTGTVRSNCIA